MCVITEHQRTDVVKDEDLVCLSPAGFAHLDMLSNFDYLAACAEDTWVADEHLAQVVAERIGAHGPVVHYARETTRRNAADFSKYLVADAQKEPVRPESYLERAGEKVAAEVQRLQQEIERRIEHERSKEGWGPTAAQFVVGDTHCATVLGCQQYGVFVQLDNGPKGLIHIKNLPGNRPPHSFAKGEKVLVRLLAIAPDERKMSLALIEPHGSG
jgi:RecJ-like exonuclease